MFADWQVEQIRHQQESEAARLLALVKSGQTLSNAAWGSGLQVTHSPVLSRGKPAGDVPADLARTLFSLKPGEATMVETNAGFLVGATGGDHRGPDPKSDASGLGQTEQGLRSAFHDDYLTVYANALREQAKPVIRPGVLQSLLAQQQTE